MSEVELCNSFRVDCFIAWDEDRHLAAVCICDGEDGIDPPDGGNFVMKSIAIVSKGLVFSAGVIGNSGRWVG